MKLATAFAVLALSSSAALADGPTLYTPPVVPPPPTAPVLNWTGVYAGLYYAGAANGEMFDIGGPYVLNNGSFYGGFLGYRHDLGNFVLGGEIARSFGTDLYQNAFPTWAFQNFTDVRVSVGRDFGRALVYLSGGYTTSGFNVGVTPFTYDGWNAGIGLDYMVSDRFFLGAEYVHRSVSRTDNRAWTGEFGVLQVRGGFRF